MLFKPADAWRVRWHPSTDMPWPKDEPTLPNPPEGTAIDYARRRAKELLSCANILAVRT